MGVSAGFEQDDDDFYESEPGLEELKKIAADWRSESVERLNACVAVLQEERGTGRDLLLALSVCLDADDSERLSALQLLLKMDPATVAGAAWLMWETAWGRLEGAYKYEAASMVPSYRDVEEYLAAGISVIVANSYLDDLYRIWAGAYRTIQWTRDSYAQLRTLFSDRAIVVALAEVAKRGGQTPEGVLIGHMALRQIVSERSMPTAIRFEAADWMHIHSDEDGADAFEILATDPGLDEAHRLRAARELASIDEERATQVYPDLRTR